MRQKLTLKLKGAGIVILDDKNQEPRIATKENYGIWSVAENNDFHPDIKSARDVTPKPEDYFIIPFRFISACIVGGESKKATKFTADVLKSSMDKMLGIPVYTDHDTETVTNCIGYVESVQWSDGYTLADGTVVPPGIEGNYAIDSKIAPGVGRNLLTGGVNSNSVTVEFFWKPSHTLPENVSFWDVLGTYDPQGNMYCRLVDEIVGYLETSPVFRGADPFAKGLDKDGKVKKVDKANVYFSADDKIGCEEEKAFGITCTNGIGKLHLNKEQFIYQQRNADKTTNTAMHKNLLAFIAKQLKKDNLTAEELTDDMIQSFTQSIETDLNSRPSTEEFTRLQGIETATRTALGLTAETVVTADSFKAVKVVDVDSYTALEAKATKHDELVNQVTSLTAERDSLQADAKVGKSVIAELKAEAIRLHNAVSKGKPSDAVLKLINEAKDTDTVKGLIQSFGGNLTTSEFKAICTRCETGDHVSFQSSVKSDNGSNKTTLVEPLSKEAIDEKRLKDTEL